MRKIGMHKMTGLIVGALILAALIGPVSAACSLHIKKIDNLGNPLEDWQFQVIPPVTEDPGCTQTGIFTIGDGIAHFDLGPGCQGTGYTVRETMKTGWHCVDPCTPDPAFPERTDLECHEEINDPSIIDATFTNARDINVPEFPTLAVSLATLVTLGFVVYTIKQKDQ